MGFRLTDLKLLDLPNVMTREIDFCAEPKKGMNVARKPKTVTVTADMVGVIEEWTDFLAENDFDLQEIQLDAEGSVVRALVAEPGGDQTTEITPALKARLEGKPAPKIAKAPDKPATVAKPAAVG